MAIFVVKELLPIDYGIMMNAYIRYEGFILFVMFT